MMIPTGVPKYIGTTVPTVMGVGRIFSRGGGNSVFCSETAKRIFSREGPTIVI